MATVVDNFDLIKTFLSFDSDDDFYFLQIIQRRKDAGNEEMTKGRKLKDTFYIYKMEDLDYLKPKIIEICEKYNARAYFRLNKRSQQNIAFQSLKLTTDYIVSGQFKNVKNVYLTCAGRHSSAKKDKLWILDIDDMEDVPKGERFY